MNKIFSIIIYSFIYEMIFFLPFILTFLLLDYFNIENNILNAIILILSVIGLIFIAPYRAKLASDLYCESNKINFWEAHKISGVMLKTNMSFLPIIGFLFKAKEKDDDKNE